MRIKSYEDMNLQDLDVMKEIGNIGTAHAAGALSRMIQKDIRISIPCVNVQGYDEAVSHIGDIEELVGATLVKMEGDVEGLMLLLFKLDFANTVLNGLLGKEYNSFEEMGELEYSALLEVGNIIICSYINAFAQLTGMKIDLSVPGFTVNMLGGILTVPITELGNDKLMFFNADFVMDEQRLPDWLLMLPDIESLNHIMARLGVL
ncbi:MAG: chemotaxis protein CheC [Lachnospiraceae bacterium]|nr:chemotaxis protein CheC [Lachnospiraceae bacterium]